MLNYSTSQNHPKAQNQKQYPKDLKKTMKCPNTGREDIANKTSQAKIFWGNWYKNRLDWDIDNKHWNKCLKNIFSQYGLILNNCLHKNRISLLS